MKQSGYQKYEAGGIAPPPDKLAKLADLFGVSTDYLLGRETGTPGVPNPEEENKAVLAGLSSLVQRQLWLQFDQFLKSATPNQLFEMEKAIREISKQ